MPWVPDLPGWAFYADDSTLRDKIDAIPDDTDILITHGPPSGIFDQQVSYYEHVGSPALTSALTYRLNPRLHVFGHIHESHGRFKQGDLTMANVALVDEFYDLKYAPTEFELETS